MAQQTFECLRTRGKARVDLAYSFQPNGANVAVLGAKGRGMSAVHTAGTGNYVVTLDEPWPDYDSIQVTIQSATLGVDVQLISEPDVKGSKQFTIAVYDSGSKASLTDLAFSANQRIHVNARLKNTTLGANY